MRRPAGLGLAAALCAWLVAAEARGGGFAVPEIGARRTAMGAVIGRPDDLSAIYHNPAGLTLTPGTNLLLSTGLSLIESSLRLGPWDASDRYLTEPLDAEGYYPAAAPSRAIAVIPMLTASTSLLRDRLVIAASVYVPNAAGAAFPDESPVRYHLLDSYVVAGNATLAAAFRVTDWLSIGAGVHLIYLRLHARRLLFPVLQGIDLGGILGKRSELVLDGSDLTGGVTLGFMLRPLRSLSFGLALISKNDVALEGDIELRFGSDAITPDKTVPGTHVTTLVIPWTLQGGVNWDVGRFVEVGAELRYYFYREFHEQRTEVKGIGLLSELVTPKNYRDSLQVSGGVKVKLPPLPSLELMAGMHFDRTPAPDETVSAEQPSFNHLGLHTGARFQATRRLRLSFTYARYFYLERRTSGSLTTPPSNFVASGGNNIITLAVEAAVGRLDAR